MAGFDISYVFQAIDKFTRPARNILKSTKRLEQGFTGLNKVVKLGAELQRKSAFIMVGTDLALVGASVGILKTASSFQQLNMSFHAMMPNQKAATALFKQLIEMSQKYGAATTLELGEASRGFLAVGASAKNIPIVLNRLMDLSAMTGKSLGSLAYGYQQTFATGIVRKKYIHAISNSVPLLQAMATVLHKTKQETMQLLNTGKIAFVTLAKAIKLLTSRGAKFFEGQRKGANTLRGAYKVVQDSLQVLTYNTGLYLAKQFGITKGAKQIRDQIMQVNASFGFYEKKYGGLVTAIIKGLLAFAALVTFNFLLGTVLRSVTIVLWIFRGAILAVRGAMILWRVTLFALALAEGVAFAPLLIFASIVGVVIYGIIRLLKHFNLWKGTMYTLGKSVTDYLITPIDHMINRLEVAIKTLGKFLSLSPTIKKVASSIEKPFAAAGSWIGGHIPVPKHLYDVQMAQRMVTTSSLPSIYKIGAPASSMLTAAQGGLVSTGVVSYSEAIATALREAFPNLNEGLKAQVNINLDGKHVVSTHHEAHAGSYPNLDIGLNMPQAAGGHA